jgi:hypothetical protein
MMTPQRILLATAALVLLGAQSASAATITLFDRAAFQAAVLGGTITQQTFDGFADGTPLGTVGGVTYSASGGTVVVTDTFLTTTFPHGIGSTSTSSSLCCFFPGSETSTFTFTSPVSAFGIDINTFAATAGAYSGTLNIGDVVSSAFDTFPGTFTGQFLGFISDTPFTSVTISANTGFSYTLDTLVFGDARAIIDANTAVPEPTTLALMGGGLLALVLQRRRRRS